MVGRIECGMREEMEEEGGEGKGRKECSWVEGWDFSCWRTVHAETVQAGEFLVAPIAVYGEENETEVNTQFLNLRTDGEGLDVV